VSVQLSDTIVAPVTGAIGREGMAGQLARFRRDPLGMLGLVLVVLIVLAAVFADVLTSYAPAAIDVKARLGEPTLAHLLGTDQLGRDVFSRVLYGGRIALEVAFLCLGVSLVVGMALGMLAGYGPRWLDNTLILAFDALRSFPTIMLALAVVTLVGPSLETIMAIIIVIQIPGYARITRTSTLSLKTNEFILAERSLGAGMGRVLAVHVLPNVIGPLLILVSMDVPVVVTIEAGLSFLGLGVRPPTPSWGSILNDGYAFIRNTPWLVVAGGVPLVLTTLGFTFLGEALRDIFDPKLRRD